MQTSFEAYVTDNELSVMEFAVSTPEKKFTETAIDELLSLMEGMYESLRTQPPKSVCMVFDFTGVCNSGLTDDGSLSFMKRFSEFCTTWDSVTEPATRAVILVIPSAIAKHALQLINLVKPVAVPTQITSTMREARQSLTMIC